MELWHGAWLLVGEGCGAAGVGLGGRRCERQNGRERVRRSRRFCDCSALSVVCVVLLVVSLFT